MNPNEETPQSAEPVAAAPAVGNKKDYQNQVADEYDKYDNDMWADEPNV